VICWKRRGGNALGKGVAVSVADVFTKKNLREKLHFVGCGALRRTSYETSLTGTEPRGLRGSGLWQAWAGALQCANGCLDSLGL
jgi:hypothetical protein